ncbi:MAG: fructosamine kinase family protein [Chitinophagaceae bacterium]
MLQQTILNDCGFPVTRYEPVQGGEINSSYCLHGPGAKYFLKVNDAKRYPGMFDQEARGLDKLRNSITLTIPAVIKCGLIEHQQYLLLEWIEPGRPRPDFWEIFGAAIATMHLQPQPFFGWPAANYIGSLPQYNTQHDSWCLFYTECRILPLVKKLFDTRAFNNQDVTAAENLCKNFEHLFPREPPALLHGDLWSGNFMTTQAGDAAIYDPAVYYGHREMDMGMTKLFGGFHERFYTAYNEVFPLEKGWLQRLPLAQLYPLLVHAVLFGGHYVGRSREIINQFAG